MLERALRAGLLFVAATGATTLAFGWGLESEFFIRVRPQFAAMVPTTAISFGVLGAAALPFARPAPAVWSSGLLLAAALLVAAISILNLLILFSGEAGNLDDFLWPSLRERPEDKMAVSTSVSFLLAAACCAQLALRRVHPVAYVTAATLGLVLCSIALVGYLFDTQALYGVFVFIAMALHTALAFAVLFVCLMIAATGRGWIWLLLGERAGSVGARRLVPIMLVGPLALCWLTLQATEAGLFSHNFRLSIVAIAMIALGLVPVLRNAAAANDAEDELRLTMADLQSALADRSLLLREVYHRVKNNLQQVNAMLLIERGKMKDKQAADSFRIMSGRVEALGMVHQLLIQSAKPSEVELGGYLVKLGSSLAAGHGLENRGIELWVDAAPDIVHLDTAMTVGLLTNELVANAIEHAFNQKHTGNVAIVYEQRSPDEKVLTVRDDGTGFGADPARNEGSIIVNSLVKQLRGTMSVTDDRGTTVSVVFPAVRNGEMRHAAD